MQEGQPIERGTVGTAKISVVVLAGTESHADLGRVLNALQLAKEAAQEGDQTELVFDGAGVQWIPELSDPDHKLHPGSQQVRGDDSSSRT